MVVGFIIMPFLEALRIRFPFIMVLVLSVKGLLFRGLQSFSILPEPLKP